MWGAAGGRRVQDQVHSRSIVLCTFCNVYNVPQFGNKGTTFPQDPSVRRTVWWPDAGQAKGRQEAGQSAWGRRREPACGAEKEMKGKTAVTCRTRSSEPGGDSMSEKGKHSLLSRLRTGAWDDQATD